MKFYVNENCIGCGLCCELCPAVFDMTDSGKAAALDLEPHGADEALAQDARRSCPAGAIEEV